MLERKIVQTDDGSSSLFLPDWNEHYHSSHGAVQEAYHVFIKNGLDLIVKSEINILEIGYGTGLNALITFFESEKSALKINYTAIEAFPINNIEHHQLNFCEFLKFESCNLWFNKLFEAKWDEYVSITLHFSLRKIKQKFEDTTFTNEFDLIYFDAFSPRVQPELWTDEIFKNMYNALRVNGLMTTYSAKGSVRRSMQKIGFRVEKKAGPKGKREMLVGMKIM